MKIKSFFSKNVRFASKFSPTINAEESGYLKTNKIHKHAHRVSFFRQNRSEMFWINWKHHSFSSSKPVTSSGLLFKLFVWKFDFSIKNDLHKPIGLLIFTKGHVVHSSIDFFKLFRSSHKQQPTLIEWQTVSFETVRNFAFVRLGNTFKYFYGKKSIVKNSAICTANSAAKVNCF